MIVIPAIDIKDGKVVRLTQGKFQEFTIYSEHPVLTAQKWVDSGASLLHVVDLDGAATGKIKNLNIIAQIAKSVFIPIQVGGGIRDEETISHLFNMGVNSVVIGTKAVEDTGFLENIAKQYGERIIVSIDSSHDRVAKQGWKAISQVSAFDLAKILEDIGVRTIIFTDIARDGMLIGPNFSAIEKMLAKVKVPLIVSGGISSLEDIKKLKALSSKGIKGIIVGKALYEARISLKEAIALCSQKE